LNSPANEFFKKRSKFSAGVLSDGVKRSSSISGSIRARGNKQPGINSKLRNQNKHTKKNSKEVPTSTEIVPTRTRDFGHEGSCGTMDDLLAARKHSFFFERIHEKQRRSASSSKRQVLLNEQVKFILINTNDLVTPQL
jgi:hypothetical protein